MEDQSHKLFAQMPLQDNSQQPVNMTPATQPGLMQELNSQATQALVTREEIQYSNEIIDKKINALRKEIEDLYNKIDSLTTLFQNHTHTYHVMAFKEITTFGDLRNQINENLSGSDNKLIGLQIHGVDVETSSPK